VFEDEEVERNEKDSEDIVILGGLKYCGGSSVVWVVQYYYW
jgi:hypothetical protein